MDKVPLPTLLCRMGKMFSHWSVIPWRWCKIWIARGVIKENKVTFVEEVLLTEGQQMAIMTKLSNTTVSWILHGNLGMHKVKKQSHVECAWCFFWNCVLFDPNLVLNIIVASNETMVLYHRKNSTLHENWVY